MPCTKQKILSLQKVGQKRKIVVKIEITPLSLDRNIFPFKKGFKKLSKTDLPFKFCKIGLKNTLFIFGRKNIRLLLLLLLLLFVVCCCNYLSDFGLLFFLKPFFKGTNFAVK